MRSLGDVFCPKHVSLQLQLLAGGCGYLFKALLDRLVLSFQLMKQLQAACVADIRLPVKGPLATFLAHLVQNSLQRLAGIALVLLRRHDPDAHLRALPRKPVDLHAAKEIPLL